MNRRRFIEAAASLSAGAFFAPPAMAGVVRDFGARPGDPRLARTRSARQRFPTLRGIGRGRRALNWKYFEEITGGALQPHYQGWQNGERGEGDCVGQAGALGADVLAATDILAKQQPERWVAKASVEMAYAGSRVEIGGNEIDGAGSYGSWLCRFYQEYGVLHRIKYGDIDLTGYTPGRSRQYRYAGVPDQLEPIAKQHPVQDWAVVRTWPEARDELYKGGVILLCGTWAPFRERDRDGFAQLQTGRWREEWRHCQVVIGMDDSYYRPGALVQNSHGPDWITGPKRLGQPEGSYWLSPDDLERFFKEWYSCYVLSNYVGHPQVLPRHHKFYR